MIGGRHRQSVSSTKRGQPIKSGLNRSIKPTLNCLLVSYAL
jgi:hypothetical protein